jgi:hypothetical protein
MKRPQGFINMATGELINSNFLQLRQSSKRYHYQHESDLETILRNESLDTVEEEDEILPTIDITKEDLITLVSPK